MNQSWCRTSRCVVAANRTWVVWNGISHREAQPLKLKYTLNVLQIDVYSTGSHWRQREIVKILQKCQNNSISCAAIQNCARQCALTIVWGIVNCVRQCSMVWYGRKEEVIWKEGGYGLIRTNWLTYKGKYRAARAAKNNNKNNKTTKQQNNNNKNKNNKTTTTKQWQQNNNNKQQTTTTTTTTTTTRYSTKTTFVKNCGRHCTLWKRLCHNWESSQVGQVGRSKVGG